MGTVWALEGARFPDHAQQKRRESRPAGVMRPGNSRTMPTKSPDSPSDTPADEPPRPRGQNPQEPGASSIQYARTKEPRVPVAVLLIGLVIAAAAIIAFLHFSRT